MPAHDPAFTPLDRLVRHRIRATGPLPYDEVVELALYHRDHGFYSTGGLAGRRGDFLTSPEIGPLFGVLVAEAIDREWDRCGNPSRFTVVDAGAGPGTLARSVFAASPRCIGALTYLAVERSAAQRQLHPDGARSVAEMPTAPFAGMVIANELLDNLRFTPIRRVEDVWRRVDVAVAGDRLIEFIGEPVAEPTDFLPDDIDHAVLQPAAASWLNSALRSLERGRVVVIDYARRRSGDVAIRAYARHAQEATVLGSLGLSDITVDVDLLQLEARSQPADSVSTQADWLRQLGLDELVDEGRAIWNEQARIGDLRALRARSRVREAEALVDESGLGGFVVAEWIVP